MRRTTSLEPFAQSATPHAAVDGEAEGLADGGAVGVGVGEGVGDGVGLGDGLAVGGAVGLVLPPGPPLAPGAATQPTATMAARKVPAENRARRPAVRRSIMETSLLGSFRRRPLPDGAMVVG
jgi:hypothetical protein